MARWKPGGGREPIGPAVQALFRAGEEIWEAFEVLQRARSVRWLERISYAMRIEAGHCEIEAPFEHDTGAGGEPPCRYEDSVAEEDYCPGCTVRLAERAHVRPALSRARARLRAAVDRSISGK